MEAASSNFNQANLAEQKKLEKLCAWLFLIGGIGASLASFFDSSNGLFTTWNNYGSAITSPLYFVTGLIIYLRPKWLTGAILLSVIPTMIYQQGVMFVAVHFPSTASLHSAAASGPFFPLLYIAMFIALPKGAATLSWINCAGFYLQFILNTKGLFADLSPTPMSHEDGYMLFNTMMAHPVYIIALNYIVKLRERVHVTQQEAFKNKEGFLAMLSHEIGNQLQTMFCVIDLLDLHLKKPSERRSISRLQKAAIQLKTYLRDINKLTTLENPEFRIEKRTFDLAQFLEEARDEWQAQAQDKGLQLILAVEQTLLIETDAALLRQIVSNLLSNALKYTAEGSVTIAASPSSEAPACVALEVSDTGIGIDKKFLDKIFLPHVRLENAKEYCAEGSGLGLAIVESLVANLGGSMRVESQLNRGTKFLITLPGMVA